MAASFIVCGPFPHGPVPKYGLEVADVRIAPRRVQLRLGMPVQFRRTADARRVPRRVHVDHRQRRLRGRETRRPRRRSTWNMARGGPPRPWHAARFKAPGLEYDNSGQYAEFSTFSYTGP